jgi:hypothetical protein
MVTFRSQPEGTGESMNIKTSLFDNEWLRLVGLALYYLAILVGLIVLYGKGDFSTPAFIYQGF